MEDGRPVHNRSWLAASNRNWKKLTQNLMGSVKTNLRAIADSGVPLRKNDFNLKDNDIAKGRWNVAQKDNFVTQKKCVATQITTQHKHQFYNTKTRKNNLSFLADRKHTDNFKYRNPSPSLPWEIISVPVVRPAYGTTGLLLMCQWDINLNW